MADFNFRITSGAYAGEYAIDRSDISATDVGDLIAQGGPDLDAVLTGNGSPGVRLFAGLVWIARRHGSSKGIAFRAVADTITFDSVEAVDDDGESAEKPTHPSGDANA